MPDTILPNSDVATIVAQLPVGPALLAKVAERLRADADLDDVVALIRRDTVLAAALMAVGQGDDDGDAEAFASVDAAVARFGQQETFRVLGAIAWSQLCQEPLALYRISADDLHHNGLFTGLLMEKLAPAAQIDPADAFLAGLLRSVGKVVLERIARRTADIETFPERNETLPAWETSILGYSNNEIAAAVFETWNFPATFGAAVREHYTPSEQATPMARLLYIAATTADLRGHGFPGEEEFWRPSPASLAACNLEPADVTTAAEKAEAGLARLVSALKRHRRGVRK